MSEIKVSVCVPTYNGEKYLSETLKSVLNQTREDFEVIVTDDKSTDNTYELAKYYQKKDKRVRVFQNEKNLGLVQNWNRCIELAHGEWIKFVFQDDLMNNNCLERMLADATSEAPIIFCQRGFLFDPSTEEETIRYYLDLKSIGDLFENTTNILPDAIMHVVLNEPSNFFGEPTSTLIHRTVFDRYGNFNSNLVMICDLEFWIRVAINTGIHYIPETLVQFRCHPDSTSAKYRPPNHHYRSRQLDYLILLHEYSYNVNYAPLRRFFSKKTPPIYIKRELAKKAFWLKNLGQAISKDGNESGTIKAWKEIAKAYPKLERSIYLLPYRVKSLFKNYFLWRFRL